MILSLKNITKNFGGVKAISDTSFSINEGEIYAIIGPNGAGKTTLFNIITGNYKPSSGEVLFKDKRIDKLKAHKIVHLGIARTFQNIRLFKNMRVIENVLVGMNIETKYNFFNSLFRTKKYKAEERRCQEEAIRILKDIGMYEKLHEYASNLPYGDQRKLEIARAIATGAKIILLDEPAAGMNPQESQELLQFIKKLKEDGFTIIMIEHDMSVVMNISDRIYVIDYGKRIADGKPEEIAKNPKVISAYLGGEL